MEIDRRRILLTKISPQMACGPEFFRLMLSEKDNGKLAIVRGELSGDIL